MTETKIRDVSATIISMGYRYMILFVMLTIMSSALAYLVLLNIPKDSDKAGYPLIISYYITLFSAYSIVMVAFFISLIIGAKIGSGRWRDATASWGSTVLPRFLTRVALVTTVMFPLIFTFLVALVYSTILFPISMVMSVYGPDYMDVLNQKVRDRLSVKLLPGWFLNFANNMKAKYEKHLNDSLINESNKNL